MIDLALTAMAFFVILGILFALLKPRQPVVLKSKKRWIVLDGSNVMYWRDDTPQARTVVDVLSHVLQRGYTPYVIFDASAGYRIGDRYMHDDDLAELLGIPKRQVEVVGKGEVADPIILDMARRLSANVITNDRYRDWAGEYPEVRQKGFLVRGGYKGGRLEMRVAKRN